MRPDMNNPPRDMPHMAVLMDPSSSDSIVCVGPFASEALAKAFCDTQPTTGGRCAYPAPVLGVPPKARQGARAGQGPENVEALIYGTEAMLRCVLGTPDTLIRSVQHLEIECT